MAATTVTRVTRVGASPAPVRVSRLLLLAASAASIVAVLPLGYLLLRLTQSDAGRIGDVFATPRTWELMGATLWLGLTVAIATVVLGVISAVLLVRTDFPLRRTFAVLSALPLAMPSFIAAYTWVAQIPTFLGFAATWLIMTAVTVPYVTLPVAAALRSADPATEEVARSLGQGPITAFLRTTLPQVIPAASAGALLVALYTVSDYGTPALLNHDVLTRALVSSYRASFDRTTAFVYALALVLIALIVVILENVSRRRAQQWRSARGAQRQVVARRLTPLQTAAAMTILGAPFVVAIIVPGIELIGRILRRGGTTLNAGELITAIGNTITLSGAGALLALALALPVGVLAARHRTRTARTLETGSFTGNALPGVVVGLAFVAGTLALAPALYQTVATVALAYAVLFLPKAVGSVRAATAAVPPVLEEAARALGRSPWRAWTSVTLRLAAPGVATGGLLAWVAAMKELPATLMLRPTGMDTLATELWTRTSVTAYSEAAPFALALVLLAAVPAFLLSGTLVSATSMTTPAPRDLEVTP